MIYLDNAASAPVNPRALKAALPFLTENFANPSSAHTPGREAALAIINAREKCAAALGANPAEIIFTSGGTESDNLAVFSGILNSRERGRKIVTTAIEHPAVLNAVKFLEKRGFEAEYIPPDSEGIISVKSIEAAFDDRTALVSVMAANNEIGTLQPIAEIGGLCRERGVLFHVDAVGAAGNVPIDLRTLNADYLSVSAHKIGGIMGAGLLYARESAPLAPMLFGGGQERGIRSGTENTAAIAALGEALTDITNDIPRRATRIAAMRDLLISLLSDIPDSRLNGSRDKRLCSNVNFAFKGVESEAFVLNLDLCGVCASAGSACHSGAAEQSHVLKAIGLPEDYGAVRFTLSERNTSEEITKAAAIVRECVERLRK